MVLIDKLFMLLTEHNGAPHDPCFFFFAQGTVFLCFADDVCTCLLCCKTKSLILAWIKEQKESN